jgi:hypothetical protein
MVHSIIALWQETPPGDGEEEGGRQFGNPSHRNIESVREILERGGRFVTRKSPESSEWSRSRSVSL